MKVNTVPALRSEDTSFSGPLVRKCEKVAFLCSRMASSTKRTAAFDAAMTTADAVETATDSGPPSFLAASFLQSVSGVVWYPGSILGPSVWAYGCCGELQVSRLVVGEGGSREKGQRRFKWR